MPFDAIIVGGSFAGLSAAIYIARGRNSVCVIDAGQTRNRFSPAAHGLFGHDGAAPDALRQTARTQLAAYPEVTFIDDVAATAHKENAGFAVTLAGGEVVIGARLVLAMGVKDILPPIPGLAERWGVSVLHCPYCHGYEFNNQALGVIASGPMMVHRALMIANWGPTTLFLNGEDGPDEAGLRTLRANGVAIEPGPIAALEGDGAGLDAVRLADGRRVLAKALYIAPRTELPTPFAEQLGCALDDAMTGPLIRVDAEGMTTTPGVYACGDVARAPSIASLAVADGVNVGAAISRGLIFAAADMKAAAV